MKLLVVIVNYRTAGLTIDALRSLEPEIQETGGSDAVRVVVTDNASPDDSAPRLAAAIDAHGWSDWATLMPLPRNGGFAYGNNEAIRPVLASDAPPPYILLLNPDTLVRPGAIAALIDFMDQNPKVGIAGSRLEDPDGTPQCSAFRFPTIPGELEGTMRFGPVSRLLARWSVASAIPIHPAPADWVAGASMIIRREVFQDIGLLDEGYFMYYEEVDFCHRARRAGWPCWYVPESRVVHLVGQSSGVTDTKSPAKRRPAYWFESRRRYFLRNHNPVYALLADIAWAVGFVLWRLRRSLERRPDTDPPHMLGDFLRHSLPLHAMRSGRTIPVNRGGTGFQPVMHLNRGLEGHATSVLKPIARG